MIERVSVAVRMARIRRVDLVGKRAYVPLHYGRSTGIGARSEAAALPNAGQQAYNKAVYDLKYLSTT